MRNMTLKLFYLDPYLREASARIEAVELNGKTIRVKLDRTIFYPEGEDSPAIEGL